MAVRGKGEEKDDRGRVRPQPTQPALMEQAGVEPAEGGGRAPD